MLTVILNTNAHFILIVSQYILSTFNTNEA